ncbi:Patellin-6 [Camellia lanceoleosa]|nr:Patellin-6 [Camellia lanceoleosa]
MHGFDREGHPVCYNAYGVFKDKDMYDRIFGDDEKLQKFLRWRVQVLERGLSFCISNPGLTDYSNIHQCTMVLQCVVFNVQSVLTQRTKSKFVISKEGNAAETLYKFIRPEDVPVQYGGLSQTQ